MTSKHITISLLLLGSILSSCNDKDKEFDASGTFEATETIVSAEANGKILALNINEGDILKEGQQIGYIDSTQLHLSKLQLMKNQKSILSGRPDINVQLQSLEREKASAISDRKRIEILVKGDVASQKQLDDANTKIRVLQSKIDAMKSSLSTTTSTLNEQGGGVGIQLQQIEDQLHKCNITSPVNGTVLTKYSNTYEMAAIGKPLYKIADLSTIILRAYITGNQLSQVKINQKVNVSVDDGKGGFKTTTGTISWINDKAEFTPKTIQTKDERANMVYAIKVKVANDGTYKIGMYGEIKFQ
ncbi:MAG TPA: HlyD family efflux transporter periplasmic adaptor subunit [Flavobacterium sp.]|uniref:HlyD family secretion protein n=1 Tax=Flavobacterium sp. TaxID=239 RepID=UPI002B9DB99A|nr:HlyD family efflux transporter periplasmic adaptor subunit [Flavobacterium sp.]HSD13970.1 HlyD family efflux transporter periplasmic adaptor subunit [Flavobacterium sp.]